MCLETTKQGYVILAAFDEAGKKGLTFESLIKNMARISQKVFKTDSYAHGPLPLRSNINGMLEAEELLVGENGRLIISPRGKRNFEIFRDEYVAPEFAAALVS